MGDDNDATLCDHTMALFHSNESPLTHHVDRADGFTDLALKMHQFMVFPENGAEAELRIAMIASNATNEKG